MTFHAVVDNLSEGSLVILIIITLPICILATCLRFLGTIRAQRKPGWEDWFALCALIPYLVYCIIAVVGISIAKGVDPSDLSFQDAITTSKLAYAAGPFFEINQLFAKASIFTLYYRIFSTNRTFRFWTTVLVIVQVCWFISIFFCLIFLCVPVSKWWDISGEEDGWCMNDAALLAAEETINSCIDFIMVGLAVFIVRKLQMKKSSKWKLGILFAIGGLSGVLGFVKIIEVYAVPDTNGKENVSNAFWDLVQMASSIICCCAPVYKNILPNYGGGWRRLRSLTSFRKHSQTPGAHDSESGNLHGKNSSSWLREQRDIEMV